MLDEQTISPQLHMEQRWLNNATDRLWIKFPIDAIPKEAIITEANIQMCFYDTSLKKHTKRTSYALKESWDCSNYTRDGGKPYKIDYVKTNANWDYPAIPRYLENSFDLKHVKIQTFDITSIVRKWHGEELDNNGIVINSIDDFNGCTNIIDEIYPEYLPEVYIKYIIISSPSSTRFVSNDENICTNDHYYYSKKQKTALVKTITFMVKNKGQCSIEVSIQISPDARNFISVNCKEIVNPHESIALVPPIFAKYTRLFIKGIDKTKPLCAKVWYQAQI